MPKETKSVRLTTMLNAGGKRMQAAFDALDAQSSKTDEAFARLNAGERRRRRMDKGIKTMLGGGFRDE